MDRKRIRDAASTIIVEMAGDPDLANDVFSEVVQHIIAIEKLLGVKP